MTKFVENMFVQIFCLKLAEKYYYNDDSKILFKL